MHGKKRILAVGAAALALCAPVNAQCLITGESLSVGASSAIVMEAESGKVLFSQNIHVRLPMASTTKIMTAMLTLEQPEAERDFTVDSEAIQVEGSSMGLAPGDSASLYTLAVGMLLSSGNDAANAAAVRIDGSVEAFTARMNRRAAELGMNNTHFSTPSGLDAEDHYSTAYDMALLARAAMQSERFCAIASARRMTVRFGNPPYPRTLLNHNRLLSLYDGAIGVKTGFTKKAGRCLVSAAERNGVRLICVTLNCPDDWNTHRTLFERYFGLTSREELVAEPISLPVEGGLQSAVRAVQQGPLRFTVVKGQTGTAKSRIICRKFYYAPVSEGDILGKIVYYNGDRIIGEQKLVADESVGALPVVKKAPFWQFWKK